MVETQPSASNLSAAQRLARLDPAARAAFWNRFSESERAALMYDWSFWGRPAQFAPAGGWSTWLIQAGRGFGKTRCGAEWVRSLVEKRQARRIALVAPTAADVRDVMVEGESGILAVCPPWDRPRYEPSKRRLTWKNGAVATTYSADEPERLRGPQHDAAWCDEVASWRYPAAWDMLMFGLRLGENPRTCVTTTPKPVPLFKSIKKSPGTALTRGSTYDNRENLAPTFFNQIITVYEGTRLGRQELAGEELEDTPGALWTLGLIEVYRLAEVPPGVALERIVVGLDPSATDNEDSDEAGIVTAARGSDGHLYVLADDSLQASPLGWAKVAIGAYDRRKADRLVAEKNNGGDMVEAVVRTADPNVSYKSVWASRGKLTRAEPIAALYEKGMAHHVGTFPDLESQMCGWMPGQPSPDRMDALVWAASDLMLGPSGTIEATENPFATLRRHRDDTPAVGGEFGGRRGGRSRMRI